MERTPSSNGEGPIPAILANLEGVRRQGDGWQARCPAHDDRKPSLSIQESEEGAVLLHCHAGCAPEDVLRALGLDFTHLYPQTRDTQRRSLGGDIVASYDYTDEAGAPLFQVRRTRDKQFPQYRWENGEWVSGTKGVRRVPYHLPELLQAAAEGGSAFLVEGEKDVHTLERLGLVATTTPGGAKSWRNEYARYFAGARVTILPDNDEPGRLYAEKAAASLRGVAADVTIINLPDLAEKGDVSDWVEAGGTHEKLERLTRPRKKLTPVTSKEASDLFLTDLERRVRGEVRGLPWPPEWPRLGRAAGALEPGTLTVIAARPSVGKSILAVQHQAFLCDHGFRVVFVSRELSPERLVRRHVVREGANMDRLKRGELTAADLEAKERYLERQATWQVLYDQVSRTPSEIRKVIEDFSAECLIVDYLQRLAYNEEREYAALTRLANELQDLALDLDIPVIALSQLSRPPKGLDHKPPTMNDVRGSGAIEERAATIVLLHRDWTTAKDNRGQEVASLRLDTGSFILAKNADGEANLWQPIRVDGERMRIIETTEVS